MGLPVAPKLLSTVDTETIFCNNSFHTQKEPLFSQYEIFGTVKRSKTSKEGAIHLKALSLLFTEEYLNLEEIKKKAKKQRKKLGIFCYFGSLNKNCPRKTDFIFQRMHK